MKKFSEHNRKVIPAYAGIQLVSLDPRVKPEDDMREVSFCQRFLSLGVLAAFVLLSSCGIDIVQPTRLEESLLKIVEVVPSDGESISGDRSVTVKFSGEVDEFSVNDSIFVAESDTLPANISEIEEEVETTSLVEGDRLLSDDMMSIEFVPVFGFEGERDYSIVVTKRLYSAKGIPLTTGSDPDEPFVSQFRVVGESSDYMDGFDGTEQGEVELTGGEALEPVEEKSPPPSYLVINEIYYDVVGSDTNGEVFMELYGEPGGNLEDYYIALVNGDDGKTYKTIPIEGEYLIGEDGIFVIADTSSDGTTTIDGADYLTNFDPQNGPDSIQLIDPGNQLVDVVGYGAISIQKAQNGFDMFETAPAEDPPSGTSLSRVEGAEDSGDNSVDFVVSEIPTPGRHDAFSPSP